MKMQTFRLLRKLRYRFLVSYLLVTILKKFAIFFRCLRLTRGFSALDVDIMTSTII